MHSTGGWNDASCEDLYSFVCYTGTAVNTKTFVYVPIELRWADARDYCRKNYTDLAVIENAYENTEVYQAKPQSVAVWIGLYRTPWTWTDGSNSLFRNWQSGQPDNANVNEFCAAENAQHEWSDFDCNVQNTFVCHEDPKGMVVKMKFQTSANMTDPAIQSQFIQQLGALLKRRGLMDIKLQWKIRPRKQENDQEELPGAQCT
ncbi:lithostathine-like [Toxotes jaculatrix]|uniref:lithostathine-like n=1 Tax=Toxotes jaculatrix TaxID=941984 RepID=UPI001B3AD812|nr:lithostathine-like [Toxotes jaculatrix]